MRQKNHDEFLKELKEKDINLEIKTFYLDANTKLLVGSKYGDCYINPSAILKGTMPEIRNAVNPTNYWINMAKEVHGNLYDYSLATYTISSNNIKIICKKHGLFEQIAASHVVKSQGCPKCAKENNKFIGKRSYTEWKNLGQISKNFDSFKVYIIECWNDDERFYKIGKTFVSLENRFSSKARMPYKWRIVKTIISDAIEICQLENLLIKNHKELKYIPKLDFHGKYECFTNIKL
jgi:hypothetical protein